MSSIHSQMEIFFKILDKILTNKAIIIFFKIYHDQIEFIQEMQGNINLKIMWSFLMAQW